jgi:hypothetical protein
MSDEYVFPPCNRYFKKDLKKLRYKFPGVKTIKNNYSQALQDIFALSILDGKRNGTYVEIGADHAVIISNSYLLETQFDWTGVSFEIDQERVDKFNLLRKNECICADARNFDYKTFFENNNFLKQIDYLQLDIEPASQTLSALKALPLDDYRFSVITYETDIYKDGPDSGEEAMQILLSKGYQLVVRNVANLNNPYEDWYVDPNSVDQNIVNKFLNTSRLSKESTHCIFTGFET